MDIQQREIELTKLIAFLQGQWTIEIPQGMLKNGN